MLLFPLIFWIRDRLFRIKTESKILQAKEEKCHFKKQVYKIFLKVYKVLEG
jgi:hypothetical protein